MAHPPLGATKVIVADGQVCDAVIVPFPAQAASDTS